MNTGKPQPISIGVITIEGREQGLRKLLESLKVCIGSYPQDCELVLCSNAKPNYFNSLKLLVESSKIHTVCDVKTIQSPENNIAVARNLLIEKSSNDWLAFIDDDEYACPEWLLELSTTLKLPETDIVAGPVIAVFPKDTPSWIVRSDLHNTTERVDGSIIQYTGTGNLLINKTGVPDLSFNIEFGKSGGSDTEFFQRNIDKGMIVRWCKSAVAYEDVEQKRANFKFMVRRFMNQGNTYRRVKSLHGKITNQFLFSIRAYIVGIASLPIALCMLAIDHPSAGLWLKRGFSNLGKVISPSRLLYD